MDIYHINWWSPDFWTINSMDVSLYALVIFDLGSVYLFVSRVLRRSNKAIIMISDVYFPQPIPNL